MKIMLDAGHGLQTPGKQAIDGTKEYTFNKMIANEIITQLNRYQNVEIHTCYSDARDVPLKERTDQANRLGVDVYVSLHNNAGPASARGTETFVYTSKPKKATALANRVQGNIIHLTGMKNRGVKTADFHVLRETDMDAILIEFAFMTNPEDLALLHNADFRRKCAVAVADALRDEYGLQLKPVAQPAPAPQPQAAAPNGGKVMYRVVTGSFSERANADKRIAELKKAGFDSFIEVKK